MANVQEGLQNVQEGLPIQNVKEGLPIQNVKEGLHQIVKEGPWGGNDGQEWEFDKLIGDSRLTGITIWSDTERVYAIQFTYVDNKGESHVSPRYGAKNIKCGPSPITVNIDVDKNEKLTEISGTFKCVPVNIDADKNEKLTEISGTFECVPAIDRVVITSLVFKTSLNHVHPFGEGDGIAFSLQVPKAERYKAKIVGFFGKHGDGDCLDNLGVILQIPKASERHANKA